MEMINGNSLKKKWRFVAKSFVNGWSYQLLCLTATTLPGSMCLSSVMELLFQLVNHKQNPPSIHKFWVNYNDLTSRPHSGIMVSKGHHPQMALFQTCEILFHVPRSAAQHFLASLSGWCLVEKIFWDFTMVFTMKNGDFKPPKSRIIKDMIRSIQPTVYDVNNDHFGVLRLQTWSTVGIQLKKCDVIGIAAKIQYLDIFGSMVDSVKICLFWGSSVEFPNFPNKTRLEATRRTCWATSSWWVACWPEGCWLPRCDPLRSVVNTQLFQKVTQNLEWLHWMCEVEQTHHA